MPLDPATSEHESNDASARFGVCGTERARLPTVQT